MAQEHSRARVKLLGNFCSPDELCREWDRMSQGGLRWNDLEFTADDRDVDFYVIINAPWPGEYYDPQRTIVFQMEPWCGEPYQTWGVKTWGDWARPDPARFLQVRAHRTHLNNAFWQLKATYEELRTRPIVKTRLLASICSPKYFDPGHVRRVDFLKFLETKNDDVVRVDLYAYDNPLGFKSWVGPLPPGEKEAALLPYRYFFAAENNRERNFITEKLWEPLLTETLCFYWGAPNAADWIDPRAFIALDLDDFEQSFRTMKQAIVGNEWEKRLDIIRQEKRKVLEQYQFFPTLERVLFHQMRMPLHPSDSEVAYHKYFSDAVGAEIAAACFVHSFTRGGSNPILGELLDAVEDCGLLRQLDRLYVFNSGDEIALPSRFERHADRIRLVNFSPDASRGEAPTLDLLRTFAGFHDQARILYLHTKGASHERAHPNVVDWRRLMLHFLVERHAEAQAALAGQDVVGCNLLDHPHRHFSGNFWWANARYLATLPPVPVGDRHQAEWWVLSGGAVRAASLHDSRIDHYRERYPRSRYTADSDSCVQGGGEPPPICLVMIVKDEAHVIGEALTSILPYIADYIVVDTGSSDGTQQVVRSFFEASGRTGQVFDRPWRDFGSNRSEALALAREHSGSEYLWMFDADDIVEGRPDLTGLNGDAYHLRLGPDFEYWRLQIFRRELPWRYVGVLHEYPVCDAPAANIGRIDGEYCVLSRRLGSRSRNPRKYEQDAAVLEAALIAQPTDARATFYLAQSWFDAGRFDRALEAYRRRAEMAGWDEEVFYSRYRVALCLEHLGRPYDDVRAAFELCANEHPHRAEPLVRAAALARSRGRYAEAYVFAKRAARIPRPDPDALFIDNADYEFRAVDEQAIAAFYCDFPDETFDLCTELLDRRELPAGERARVEGNRDHAVPHLKDAFLHYEVDLVERLTKRPPPADPQITLCITSCRRLELFIGTVCSFLIACTDIERVDRFVCIDDNSSDADREQMRLIFPFFEFICKESEQRGHARSLNLIRETVKTPWLLHLEDDWHFFAQRNYIGEALEILQENPGLGQVLFNRNYAETLEDRELVGGAPRRSAGSGYRFVLHEHYSIDSEAHRRFQESHGRRSNAWWPHYSLRPGLVRTEVFARVGPFNEQVAHFEQEYAQRYVRAGYRTAFLDGVYALHLGRLTTERGPGTRPNAYDLNGQAQFGARSSAYDLALAGEDEMGNDPAQAGLQFEECAEPTVSILLVAWNKLGLTFKCLQSIRRHSAQIDFEVIVVDNGSDDGTREFLAACSGITVLRNESNAGYTVAANQAAARARGEFLLFLNNDVLVTPGWLQALVTTARGDQRIGAVGAKLIFPDGRLQEAGSILWNDGSALGYGRGENPDAPEFNYVRDVDYCSGACLLVRRRLFFGLGGFDEAYAPAYYEDSDFCVALRHLGYRVVYQPTATVIHCEYGSGSAEAAQRLCETNRITFAGKWKDRLQEFLPRSPQNVLKARSRGAGKRVLILDDMIPVPRFGSGYPRARRLVGDLVAMGYLCTLLPLADTHPHQPETGELQQLGVEVLFGAGRDVRGFLQSRAGLYDLIIVSRPHNAERTMRILREYHPAATIIYDAEAIYCQREARMRELRGDPLLQEQEEALLRGEIELTSFADAVLTVSEQERQQVADMSGRPAYVWGHPIEITPPKTPFAQRRDILFVGGFLNPGCPNEDAALYFANEVFPRIRERLDCRLIIAGTNRLESIRNLASDSIVVTGPVEDLGAYYESARLFVVPTRFAAGLPWKLFEAMSRGLPAVVTPLIAAEMDLPEDECGFLVGENAGDFARKSVYLYNNEFLWGEFQQRALAYIRSHCDPQFWRDRLAEILLQVSTAAGGAAQAGPYPVEGPPAAHALMLRLDLTNKCNLGCIQCTLADRRRMTGEAAGEMGFDLFEQIVREVFPYAGTVALSCEAEPVLHTRFLDILRVIGDHPGRLYKITTNANSLSDEAIEAMVRAGIGEIYISIDGAREETYERIRRGGRLARVTRAIEQFNRLKQALGKGRHDAPQLHINYTLMKSTLGELPQMVELCREWSIHRLVLQHLYLAEETGLQHESLISDREQSDAMLRRCRAQCEAYGIETLFPPLFLQDSDAQEVASSTGPDCLAPWRMVRVRWNGEVFPCDLWQPPGVGNLRTASFLDIWNSPACERLRAEHARRQPTHPNCVGCSMSTTENIEGRSRRSPINYIKEIV